MHDSHLSHLPKPYISSSRHSFNLSKSSSNLNRSSSSSPTQRKEEDEKSRMRRNLKVLLLVALVSCYTLQLVASQQRRPPRWRERGVSPEEEEEMAMEEERWRREQEAEEEERRWRPPHGRGERELEPREERRHPHRGEEEWEVPARERRHRRGGGEEEEWEEEPPRRERHHPHRGGGGGGGRGEEEWEEEEEEERGRGRKPGQREERFLLEEEKSVVRTEAGEMRVVRGFSYAAGSGRGIGGCGSVERPLHVGMITMEPRSLFVPQYWDSDLVVFVQRGEAELGLIYKDRFVQRRLRIGDVYRVPAGSTFYVLNTAEGQRLHLIASIDPSEGLGTDTFQPFFIGGGTNPASVLSGFDPQTLSTAFNVSMGELRDIMTSQESGPFVFTDSHVPIPTTTWTNFHKLPTEEKLRKLKSTTSSSSSHSKEMEEEDDEEAEENTTEKNSQGKYWETWNSLVNLVMGNDNNRKKRDDKHGRRGDERETGHGPNAFNIFDAEPDFRNNYGWSIAIDKHRYKPLKKSCIGLYYVNLTAGSMMAPHVNPTATEYGIVVRGSGRLQIVYPNGTTAMDTELSEGSVFRVPRYFPFCQIASRSGPLEFFGFSTSANRNHPQFLVGTSSVLRSMAGEEFAAAFGITVDRFREIVDAQRESVVIPTPGAAPGGRGEAAPGQEEGEEMGPPEKERGRGRGGGGDQERRREGKKVVEF